LQRCGYVSSEIFISLKTYGRLHHGFKKPWISLPFLKLTTTLFAFVCLLGMGTSIAMKNNTNKVTEEGIFDEYLEDQEKELKRQLERKFKGSALTEHMNFVLELYFNSVIDSNSDDEDAPQIVPNNPNNREEDPSCDL